MFLVEFTQSFCLKPAINKCQGVKGVKRCQKTNRRQTFLALLVLLLQDTVSTKCMVRLHKIVSDGSKIEDAD